jgi:hypothetical protein
MQIYYNYIYLIVKVHGVLPSTANMFASARTIQFHEFHTWDSIAVVTPFMHDTNYVSRDFATLGQLELLPSFAVGLWTGVRLYT